MTKVTPTTTTTTTAPANTTKGQEVNDLVTAALDTEANADSLWSKTGDIIVSNKVDFMDSDAKAQAKAFSKRLDADIDSTLLPTGQVMSRSGDMIDLLKTNGKVKWSSWVVTSRIVQNTSDIWKGCELLGYDTVFPNGKLISRYELRKMIKEVQADSKVPETALETISRCLELVAKKIAECEQKDLDGVNQRMIEVNIAHSEWKESVK